MLRLIVYLAIFSGLFYCGSTIPLGHTPTEATWPFGVDGRLTFFGHVRALWHTEQVQDLKQGIEDKAGPAANELKKKVHNMTSDGSDMPDPTAPAVAPVDAAR
jgi:hypothetical protein